MLLFLRSVDVTMVVMTHKIIFMGDCVVPDAHCYLLVPGWQTVLSISKGVV